MFHRHKWSKWVEVEKPVIHVKTGYRGVDEVQQRRCETCGKIKEKGLL